MWDRVRLGAGLAHCWPSDVAGELASLQSGDRWRAIHLALNKEFGRARTGSAHVRIPDLRREEFNDAIGGALAAGGGEGRGESVTTRRSLEFDTRVLLDLLFNEAFREVLKKIDGEASRSLRAFLGLFPDFRVTHAV
jgi:hypothetical protein